MVTQLTWLWGWTLGMWEVVIIAAVVLVLFSGRLPGAMRSIGQGLVQFKKGMKDEGDEAEGSEAAATTHEKT